MKMDERDLDHFFRLYYRQLCIYALHFVENAGVVEDIVQDAFVALWQRKDEVKDLKPYLFSSVRNRCLSFIKKRQPDTQDLPDNLPEEDLEDRSEIETRLWTAIDTLPERRRQVLLMSKRDGMKYEDIAYHLGISVNTVRNHVSKALESLRNIPLKIYSLFFCAG